MKRPPMKRSDEARFRSYIQTGSGCQEWNGARSTDGYGQFMWWPEPDRRIQENAHRVAWRLSFGIIPDGMYVCHRCDNPPCCNPAHLFLGTPTDNARDRESKGRGAKLRGELNPNSKLTDAAVQEIRALFKAGVTQRAVAKQFHIDQSLVSYVVRRKVWSHIA